MPFFSIIVPVYNTEVYLKQCLLSLKNQSFADFEVIVVNDGSPNKGNFSAKQIFDNISDTRFCYFEQPNSGVSSARNLGLEKAKGDWICFVDSDDFVEDQFLEKTLATIGQGKNPHNQIYTFGQDQDTLSWAKFSKFVPETNNFSNSLVFTNHLNVGSMVFDKKYIQGIKFPLMHGGEDVAFGWRYIVNFPNQNVSFANSGAKYYYRQHPNQHSRSENAEVIQFAQSTKFLEINIHRIKSLRNKVLAYLFIARFTIYIEKIQAHSKIKKLGLSLSAKFLTLISILLGSTKKAK